MSKYKCDNCKCVLTREDKNFQQNSDLLIFFKAYKVFNCDNNLGNLCITSDFLSAVFSTAISTFYIHFKNISHCKDIGKTIKNIITLEISNKNPEFWAVDEPCKSHREFIISFYVRVQIFYALKWINKDARDSKKIKRKNANKADPEQIKLQKLRHE